MIRLWHRDCLVGEGATEAEAQADAEHNIREGRLCGDDGAPLAVVDLMVVDDVETDRSNVRAIGRWLVGGVWQ